jgi:hypothetical protein
MSVFASRNFVSWVIVILFPLSLLAVDTGSAIVHSNGGVRVNGAEVPDFTTVFAGDLLETKPGFMAQVAAPKNDVTIPRGGTLHKTSSENNLSSWAVKPLRSGSGGSFLLKL